MESLFSKVVRILIRYTVFNFSKKDAIASAVEHWKKEPSAKIDLFKVKKETLEKGVENASV